MSFHYDHMITFPVFVVVHMTGCQMWNLTRVCRGMLIPTSLSTGYIEKVKDANLLVFYSLLDFLHDLPCCIIFFHHTFLYYYWTLVASILWKTNIKAHFWKNRTCWCFLWAIGPNREGYWWSGEKIREVREVDRNTRREDTRSWLVSKCRILKWQVSPWIRWRKKSDFTIASTDTFICVLC